ncbi:MAG: hypothetical protein ACP5UQ_05135 [Anaerolineae bacterium]
MSQSGSPHPWPVGEEPAGFSFPDLASVLPADPPSDNSHKAEATLRIAVPEDGRAPGFDNIYAVAVASALLDQSVLVICLTDELLADWRRRLQERGRPLDGLTLVDGRFGWSANWRAFFQHRSYDITVMHGIHTALQEQRIPRPYAIRLVDAVSKGVIVLA